MSDAEDYRYVGIKEIRQLVNRITTNFLYQRLSLVNPKSCTFYIYSFDSDGFLAAQMFVTEANRLLKSQPFKNFHEEKIWSFELTDKIKEADMVMNMQENSLNCKSFVAKVVEKATGERRNLPVICVFQSDDKILLGWTQNANCLQRTS